MDARKESDIGRWIKREDTLCFQKRKSRMEWLASKTSSEHYRQIPGGDTNAYLLNEAKHCFVYGYFVATVLVGFAFIESRFSAIFRMLNHKKSEKGIYGLIRKAHSCGMISNSEMGELDKVRRRRNSYAHHRGPKDAESMSSRIRSENKHLYDVAYEDAKTLLDVMFRITAVDELHYIHSSSLFPVFPECSTR